MNSSEFSKDALKPGFTMEEYEASRKTVLGEDYSYNCNCVVGASRYFDPYAWSDHRDDCNISRARNMIRNWSGE